MVHTRKKGNYYQTRHGEWGEDLELGSGGTRFSPGGKNTGRSGSGTSWVSGMTMTVSRTGVSTQEPGSKTGNKVKKRKK